MTFETTSAGSRQPFAHAYDGLLTASAEVLAWYMRWTVAVVKIVVCRRTPIHRLSPHQGISMSSIRNAIRRFVREESGATMVEYGIMVALVAAVAIAVVKVVGSKVNNGFQSVNANM